MTVYVELVIFNNFFIDLAIILATSILCKKKISPVRAILSALVGAGVGTVFPLLREAAKWLVKILLVPVMTAIAYKFDGKKFGHKAGDYIVTVFCFILLTFMTGGIVMGGSYLLNVDLTVKATLGLSFMGVCFLLVGVKAFLKKRETAKILNASFMSDGKNISLRAFCDSGNSLTDEGVPVVILSENFAKRYNISAGERKINVSTVNGEEMLSVLPKIEIEVDGKIFPAEIAISNVDFDNFDMILQNSMF